MRCSATTTLGLIALLTVTACAPRAERVSVKVGSDLFTVEVARTDAQHERGLMYRQSLGSREGMLFVFTADQHLVFWMKNTRIPLSIAFLSAEGRILQIEDLEPYSQKAVRSRRSARYALELPRGGFAAVGAAEGDIVVLPESVR